MFKVLYTAYKSEYAFISGFMNAIKEKVATFLRGFILTLETVLDVTASFLMPFRSFQWPGSPSAGERYLLHTGPC